MPLSVFDFLGVLRFLFEEVAPRFGGSFSNDFFVVVRESGGGVIADGNGDFRYRQVGGFQEVRTLSATQIIQVTHDGYAVFFIKRVRDIVFVEEEIFG